MARHTAKSHKIRKVEILVIQIIICLLIFRAKVNVLSVHANIISTDKTHSPTAFYGLKNNGTSSIPRGSIEMARIRNTLHIASYFQCKAL